MYTYSNVFEPEPYLYEFELSEQLEEKWKCGIEKGISMFLSDNQESIYSFSCELTKEDKIGSLSITLHLPNFPKTIEEMKIARYVFQQIFTCTFKQANFHNVIFNPQMIELLFDDNITKMPLQIHTRQAWLLIFADYYDKNLLLKCILHHILSNNFIPIFHSIRSDQAFEVLFKILTNGGNKFSKVSQSMEVYFKQDFREDFKEDFREYLREHSENLTKLYNHLIEHIVETEDISKMVKELGFYLEKEPTIISKKAKNIEIKVEVYGENDWFYIGGWESFSSLLSSSLDMT
ncbi:unnamed protein product [Meloidogyne enterolobii]|uniref:Uncharacterized protein n=1 Tax=Meloidogyne enterolobii TaxID=390850 RepID=A0ACB1A7C0_MELEN